MEELGLVVLAHDAVPHEVPDASARVEAVGGGAQMMLRLLDALMGSAVSCGSSDESGTKTRLRHRMKP